MKTIYAVSEGSYSDYHIIAVFDDEALADQCAKLLGADVETFELNPHEDRWRAGLAPWCVVMERDGAVANAYVSHYSAGQPDEYKKGWPGRAPHWVFHVWAESKEHAVKVSGERRVRILAEAERIRGEHA